MKTKKLEKFEAGKFYKSIDSRREMSEAIKIISAKDEDVRGIIIRHYIYASYIEIESVVYSEPQLYK